jgi:hypothetical protein
MNRSIQNICRIFCYLCRKAEGMMASLDETLVCSNIHLPRVEREKRAVQEATKEAMEIL